MMQLYIHKFSEIKEIIRKSDLTDSPKALYPEKYFVYFIIFLKQYNYLYYILNYIGIKVYSD